MRFAELLSLSTAKLSTSLTPGKNFPLMVEQYYLQTENTTYPWFQNISYGVGNSSVVWQSVFVKNTSSPSLYTFNNSLFYTDPSTGAPLSPLSWRGHVLCSLWRAWCVRVRVCVCAQAT